MERDDTLDTAKSLISGDRNDSYGSAQDSFDRIAKLWGAAGVTIRRRGTRYTPSAKDVAILMSLVKIARLTASPDHDDSWVDLAGYAALGSEVQ